MIAKGPCKWKSRPIMKARANRLANQKRIEMSKEKNLTLLSKGMAMTFDRKNELVHISYF